MKQMCLTNPHVIAQMPFGQLKEAVIVLGGRIFFAGTHGSAGVVFPVMEDGTVSRSGRGEDIPYPDTQVDIIHPKSLGVELKFAADLPPALGM